MPGVPHVRDPSTPLWVRGPRVPRGPDRGPGGGDMGWRGAFEGWRGPGRHPLIRDLWESEHTHLAKAYRSGTVCRQK